MTAEVNSTQFLPGEHILGEDNDNVQPPMEIESLCMNCYENGMTKLMSTRIPFYKQVIIISFLCDHCGYKNNEIQSGEAVQEFGTEIVLNVKQSADLNRTVVKSEYASIEIPEVELTIPSKSQPGEVTTVEGILQRVQNGLRQDQDKRKEKDPETAGKIEAFIARLNDLFEMKQTWTLKLKDPSGNCFIQNPDPLHVDPRCITSHYCRTLDEEKLLGFADDDATEKVVQCSKEDEWKSYEDVKNEILHFPGSCQSCGAPVETLMKPTDIPYFQTVIIMCTMCDRCGFKSNDVKSGGATKDLGCKLSVRIEKDLDLARDVLKSDTCALHIPELDIEIGPGALSGRFTTVEGLLNAIKDQLKGQCAFFLGDSATSEERQKLQKIMEKLDEAIALKSVCTLVLDDPAGNSYVMSLAAPLDDSRLQKEFYTRTYEQNEELGLNDMKTENYESLNVITEEEEKNETES
ncbi:ZPR1 zinc-finger domain-containing protein [Ditylenchus destructor]|uniref:ZPR1 zinc-finger domain-containing protein n=1 Tax=Ditylenchus destructor TaxID=166010 RepID=A0AAD4RAC2_9BILA|nr:ZPR1 zinc-finger domain-containing protein [Ditylenchus destructor]